MENPITKVVKYGYPTSLVERKYSLKDQEISTEEMIKEMVICAFEEGASYADNGMCTFDYAAQRYYQEKYVNK